jgi:hypothetical protein
MIDIIGEKVMVYYNLHKKTFSVKHKNKVVTHTDNLVLKDVEFRVRQGGRFRVLTEGNKNVHAFVIGTLKSVGDIPPNVEGRKVVTYNPYKWETFLEKENCKPIHFSNTVFMVNGRDKIFI